MAARLRPRPSPRPPAIPREAAAAVARSAAWCCCSSPPWHSAVLASILLFRGERAALLNRQLSETRLVQLQAIRAALAGTDDPERSDAVAELSTRVRRGDLPPAPPRRRATRRPRAR